MTLNIEFTAQGEAWIASQAEQHGLPAAEIVRRVIDERALSEGVPATIDARTAAAIAYLDRRIAEASAATPEENRKAQEEYEELKRNLNANRAATDDHPVFP